MSLDIYAEIKGKKIYEYEKLDNAYRDWSREERFIEGQDMTNEVFHMNITHNLTEMASHVPISDTEAVIDKECRNLYYLMWRPEEFFKNVIHNEIRLIDVRRYLEEALQYLLSHEKELSKYNPENGWGHYENFVHWLPDYIRACYKWPNAIVEVSR